MQTRTQSAVETGLNVGSGALLAWLATLWLLPHWHPPYTGWTALQITTLYTVISLARSYLWRRWFECGENMSEWRSIETAPKDGTRVLLFVPGIQNERCTGVWNNDGEHQPTHWKPLPPPPNKGNK